MAFAAGVVLWDQILRIHQTALLHAFFSGGNRGPFSLYGNKFESAIEASCAFVRPIACADLAGGVTGLAFGLRGLDGVIMLLVALGHALESAGFFACVEVYGGYCVLFFRGYAIPTCA